MEQTTGGRGGKQTTGGGGKQTTRGEADGKLKSPDKMSTASSASILGCGRRQSKA